MKKILSVAGKIVLILLCLGAIYILTLCFPEPFFSQKITVDNISVYSDETLPETETIQIIKTAAKKLQKSALYKPETKQRMFIANNPLRWAYFSNINNKAGGLNYICFNHSIFLRKSDVKNNRLYGPSGKKVPGTRTLDYFMTHEMTHTFEFQSMPWYRYPINTNWLLEGYCEYIAHGSENYQTSLDHYLNGSKDENKGAKYYSKIRTMVAYLLEEEAIPFAKLWTMKNEYSSAYTKTFGTNTSDNKPDIGM